MPDAPDTAALLERLDQPFILSSEVSGLLTDCKRAIRALPGDPAPATTRIDDGGPAFPLAGNGDGRATVYGMSIRDWFAGQAMAGIMARDDQADYDKTVGESVEQWRARMRMLDATYAYALADAMLAAAKGGEKVAGNVNEFVIEPLRRENDDLRERVKFLELGIEAKSELIKSLEQQLAARPEEVAGKVARWAKALTISDHAPQDWSNGSAAVIALERARDATFERSRRIMYARMAAYRALELADQLEQEAARVCGGGKA